MIKKRREKRLNKLGLAPLITVVLILLLVFSLFLILWNVFYNLVVNAGGDVGIDGFLVDGELEYYLPADFSIIKVKRNSGEGEIKGLRIVFNDDSNTYSYETDNYPNPLETKIYVIQKNELSPNPSALWNFTKVKEISLHYVLPDEELTHALDREKVEENKENKSKGFSDRWYEDCDDDYYGLQGSEGYTVLSDCEDSSGCSCVPISGDCNDNDEMINPGVDEICNEKDEDCDGVVDENSVDCSDETPYCHEGSCSGNKDYVVSEHSLDDFYTECNENEETDNFSIDFASISDWENGIPFYNDSITNIKVCRNGYVLIEGNCQDTVPSISGTKGIFVYGFHTNHFPANHKQINHCYNNNEFIIKWTDIRNNEAELIINKNNIYYFDYKENQGFYSSNIGISYGDDSYKNKIYSGTNIDISYKLEF